MTLKLTANLPHGEINKVEIFMVIAALITLIICKFLLELLVVVITCMLEYIYLVVLCLHFFFYIILNPLFYKEEHLNRFGIPKI